MEKVGLGLGLEGMTRFSLRQSSNFQVDEAETKGSPGRRCENPEVTLVKCRHFPVLVIAGQVSLGRWVWGRVYGGTRLEVGHGAGDAQDSGRDGFLATEPPS